MIAGALLAMFWGIVLLVGAAGAFAVIVGWLIGSRA